MDYEHGEYLEANPTWHAEDSAWKVEHVLEGLADVGVDPESVLDVGCGAGRVLAGVAARLPGDGRRFLGVDVSPDAIALARRETTDPRCSFEVADGLDGLGRFDVVQLIDVVEHVRDYFGLLERVREHADHVVAHVPLELNAASAARRGSLRRARVGLGHIHHFNVDTAIAAFEETGFEVGHVHYTAGANELPGASPKRRLAGLVRRGVASTLGPAAAAHLLGGYSVLLVAHSTDRPSTRAGRNASARA